MPRNARYEYAYGDCCYSKEEKPRQASVNGGLRCCMLEVMTRTDV